MIVIQPDYTRNVTIEGVPAPVPRPVDIDQSITGFSALRTLRIYRFDQGSVIDGHAEEDEVFIVVLEGAVSLTMTAHSQKTVPLAATLKAPDLSSETLCAAYLPPHGAYQLVALTSAEVAYARATPVHSQPPKFFSSRAIDRAQPTSVLAEEMSYAERLRLRLISFSNQPSGLLLSDPASAESMAYFKTTSPSHAIVSIQGADGSLTSLNAADTVAIPAGAHPTLYFTGVSAGIAVIVSAH